MRSLPRTVTVLCSLALAVMLLMPMAQASSLSKNDKAQIRNFTLSETFIHRVEAMVQDARDGTAPPPELDMSQVDSLDELAQKLDSKPGMHELLAKHHLTAKEYVTGTLALASAMMVAQASEDPGQAKYLQDKNINAHNVAFYKAHRQEIDRFMGSAGGD